MDAVIRATAIYLVLLLLFRVLGKRTMAQVTTFDFVLLLIVSEATQQALLGDDFSVTNAVLVIATLMAWSYVADVAGFRNKRLQKVAQSIPLVLVADGTPLTDRMREENVD